MSLSKNIKVHEGFRGMPYKDHLGFDTIGYGTKLPLSEKESELILKHRLDLFTREVDEKLNYLDMPPDKWDILYEMAYQMGVSGLLKFKNMIRSLKEEDYKTAAKEMLNSRWAKQTPNRASELAIKMAN